MLSPTCVGAGWQYGARNRIFGTVDHYAPTTGRELANAATPREIGEVIRKFDENMRWGDIRHFGLDDPHQGIVHVIGPGLTALLSPG